ncbi:MAG: Zn-dependent hydrolase [Alphaproteobacteria bacterium]|nr:Zn-dependent hydrolase [Alphaproteobacteria bacterium]
MSVTPTRTGHNSLADLRIDENRLWRRHMEMARIGALDGGGNCRLSMTPEDGAARDLFRSWCEDAGLSLRVDRAGNMFAIRPGTDMTAPMILTGSHLDTQPHGGRFDGISGVLTALEVMETLNDAGVTTTAPLAVVNWTNEEGVNFAPGLMGSSWFVGRLSDADVMQAQSRDGSSFESEARARGYLGSENRGDFDIGAYYELHIEQGPILENKQSQIGVVESVQGLRWLDVAVLGMDAHAGTTPMDQRQDSLQASARILVAINELGRAYSPDARVSVGYLNTDTAGASTIAGRTDFVIDIRHPEVSVLDHLADECRRLCIAETRKQNCQADVTLRTSVEPGEFDRQCVENVETAAASLGYPFLRMTSGALHDASNMTTIVPSAMVFVPCKDGISHNVNESAEPHDLAAGCNVLLRAVLASAG